MICPNCGKEYNEKMTCCISCGADLVAVEKEREETSAADLTPEEEPLINLIVPEPVPVHSSAPLSFGSDDIIVPIKHRSSKTALSGAVKFTGSLITTVVMFAMIISSVAAAGFRLLTDENKISEFADTLDIMALPAAQFTDDGSLTVQDAVYAMSQGTGLTRDNIRTIYEESTAKEFLTAQLMGYAEYIRNGTAPERLTTEQLKKVFEENIPLIDSTLGQPLNEQDIALARSEIERAKPLLDMLSHESMEQTIGEDTLIAIRLFGSVPAIVVTAALAASMLIVLRVINKKNTSTLNWGGGTILAGGAAVLAATFLFSAQLPYSNTDRLVRTVLKCTCDVISPDLYRIGGTLAVVGIVMLIWAESLRRNIKS
ncbi:MAG: zinc ribbon domain-containing protein [Oscillospiraceae bacterium]|nr:zinc ribbon domain-containing protein [Oscillospiraceae bacterium]